MNAYCKHKIHQFYESYRHRTFDQDDVALLIVLARGYSDKGSIIRELGDFLAHPDEKDRGIVLRSVQQAADHFEENYFSYVHDGNKKGGTRKDTHELEYFLRVPRVIADS